MGFAHNGHEVGVAVPARDDVLMEMLFESSSGGTSEIIAQVKPSGFMTVFKMRMAF